VIADVIVWGSAAACVAFVLAWIWRPDLRAWIEQPKYHFLAAAGRYDRACGKADGTGGKSI
jgi:hypothetical protein